MEAIQQKFYEKYAQTQIRLVRNFIEKVDWTNRFIGIKGSRGVGKTTLLLQYIKLNFKPNNRALFVSLDDLYFSENNLYEFADIFYKKGGELLVLDEVHRYNNWSTELKNIYDDMPGLKVIFTGSSLLHLSKAKADLSRRVVMYEMPGLSFREFLLFEHKIEFPIISLHNLLDSHIEFSMSIIEKIKPLSYFQDYLNYGYYPFFLENKKSFHQKLSEVILTVLEVDIPQFEEMQIKNIIYLKRLLSIVGRSVPFKPNMNQLSGKIGITLNTMKSYLKYLSDANLIALLYVPEKGINNMNKPEKIYLNNTNLINSLASGVPNLGNVRETFFLNMVSQIGLVNAPKSGDFLVDNQFVFEIGGKSKTAQQIKDIPNSFVVKDDIEIGSENIIPLWLFGFLY